MKKIIRLTESDLTRIVKRVISEGFTKNEIINYFKNKGYKLSGNVLTKKCGNVTSKLTMKLNNKGLVDSVSEEQKVGTLVSHADNLHNIKEIEDSIKYAFEKYKNNIKGCKSII